MLVGDPLETDIKRIRHAWRSAGADLLGPVDVSETGMDECVRLDGVLIFLDADADLTQRLADLLESLDVPFLFLMPDAVSDEGHAVYRLSGDAGEIEEMIRKLSCQGKGTVRH